MDPADEDANRLAARSLADGDPTAWFERLYREAAAGRAVVPWDRGGPHGVLRQWVEERAPAGAGRTALVVGAGLGDDAELIAARGFATVAFDISPTAVETAHRRFPGSSVRYVAADLLDPPAEWRGGFELVVESLTVQSLPPALHRDAIARVTELVAPGGTLVVVAAARDEDEHADGPPWPLTPAEIEAFAAGDLRAVRGQDLREPGVRRWLAEYRRVSGPAASARAS